MKFHLSWKKILKRNKWFEWRRRWKIYLICHHTIIKNIYPLEIFQWQDKVCTKEVECRVYITAVKYFFFSATSNYFINMPKFILKLCAKLLEKHLDMESVIEMLLIKHSSISHYTPLEWGQQRLVSEYALRNFTKSQWRRLQDDI